jgi:hypothetical protein
MEATQVSSQRSTQVAGSRDPLAAGTRVRLRAPAAGLHLTSDLGTVVGPDQYDGDLGYYVIHLDSPAHYDHGGDAPETLHEIVELDENLDIVDAAPVSTRLIALLVCEDVVDTPHAPGRWTIVGVHSRRRASSFPASFQLVVYAQYAGPFGAHALRFPIIDTNRRENVGELTVNKAGLEEAASYTYILRSSLTVREPGNYEIHLFVNDIDLGYCPLIISPKGQ